MRAKSKLWETASRRNTIKLCDSRQKSISSADQRRTATAKTKIKSGECRSSHGFIGHRSSPCLDYRIHVNRFINCIYPSSVRWIRENRSRPNYRNTFPRAPRKRSWRRCRNTLNPMVSFILFLNVEFIGKFAFLSPKRWRRRAAVESTKQVEWEDGQPEWQL